jgi:alanine racemase
MAQKDCFKKFRTKIEVKKKSILGNLATIKTRISDNVIFLAVVKGNAWGLGTVPYIQTLIEGGIDWIGTSAIEDALELRSKNIQLPILLLSEIPFCAIDTAINRHLRFTVCTKRFALLLAKRAAKLNSVTKVHIKINTGLNRIGILPSEVKDFTSYLTALPNIEIQGAFTHFSDSDNPDVKTSHQQLSKFLEATRTITSLGINLRLLHAANTAATIAAPETHLGMVRVGMGIAGLYPEESFRQKIKLQFPMRWMSHVAFLRRVAKGTTLGYGGRYVCPSNATIATIPIGYADGLRKCFETKGFVLIHGRSCRIAVVMMDQSLILLSPEIENITRLGDDIVILGSQEDHFLDPDEVATQVGIHTEELLCGLNGKIPRLYLD